MARRSSGSLTVRLTVAPASLYLSASGELPDWVHTLPYAVANKELGKVRLPRSPLLLQALIRQYGSVIEDIPGEAKVLLDQANAIAEAHKRLAELNPLPKPDPYGKTDWWAHQLLAYWFARLLIEAGQPGVGIFLPLGSGKTKVAIGLLDWLEPKRVLILGPWSAMEVWVGEFHKHAARYYQLVIPSHGSRVSERVREARLWEKYTSQPLVILQTYQAILSPAFSSWALDRQWDVIVADELHRIKAPTGKISRAMAELRDRARVRIGLTGTPLHHSPLDLWAQYRFLDPGVFFMRYQEFEDRYGSFRVVRGEVLPKQQANEFTTRMYSVAYHSPDLDLQLPSATHLFRHTQLGPRANAVYTELERQFVSELQAGTVTVQNAFVRLLRLQQVCCGFVITDDGRLEELGTEKEKLLQDVLEDLPQDEPLVIFAVFHHDMDRVKEVCQKMGRKVGELSGRQRDTSKWQSEEIDTLIVEPRAGGESVDLSRAAYAIYYSLRFSLGEYEQTLKRLHRKGQSRPVRFLHLVVSGTVEERKYKYLQARKQVVEGLVREYTQRSAP